MAQERLLKRRLLLVENHDVFARVVVEQFLGDFHVTTVSSLRQARKALREEERFACVLVDHDLDDGKGDEVVRLARAQRPDAVVVWISAHEVGNERLGCAGAHAVCRKADFERIPEMLAGLLAARPLSSGGVRGDGRRCTSGSDGE